MGLFKLLLTGDDDELALDPFAPGDESSSDVSQEEFAADRFAPATTRFPIPFASGDDRNSTDDPQKRLRPVFARDAAVTRQRDELLVRVDRLHLAVESLLRLLQEKGVLTDLDLHRMTREVDRKDGGEVSETQGHLPTVHPVVIIPDNCPMCEAKISAGKRVCVLCGHSFDDDSLAGSHAAQANKAEDTLAKV